MPELPEIHRYANRINDWAAGVRFEKLLLDTNHKKGVPVSLNTPARGGFCVIAKARGKELRLHLKSVNEDLSETGECVDVTFGHGLVGQWMSASNASSLSLPKGALFGCWSADVLIYLHDPMRLSSWQRGGFSVEKRGPDPIDEFREFKAYIYDCVEDRTHFHQRICELMLDQRYFNGIGNYLRAEILYRAQVDPFLPANKCFTRGERSNKILDLCNEVPNEVLSLNLDKYGTAEEKQRFHDWLQCYDKKTATKDTKGRKFYYCRDLLSQIKAQAINNNDSNNSSNMGDDNDNNSLWEDVTLENRKDSIGRMLVAISVLIKTNRIDQTERLFLKERAFQFDATLYALLEAFAAEENKDFDDLCDSFRRYHRIHQSKQTESNTNRGLKVM